MRPVIRRIFTVETLTYLCRGGRVSKTAAFAGNMLSIKPVLHVDDAGKLLGVLVLDRVRHVMFRTELYHKLNVASLMSEVPARLSVGDSMDVVMAAFERTKAWTLPVVAERNIFVGFIRRSHVFALYRTMVHDMSEE